MRTVPLPDVRALPAAPPHPRAGAAGILALAAALTFACNKLGGRSDGNGARSAPPGGGGRQSVEVVPGYLSPNAVQPLAARSVARPPAAFDTIDPKLVEPAQPENVVPGNPAAAPAAGDPGQ